MIICPQCQFDNPEGVFVCQECGCSLIERSCPHCDSAIAFTALFCPHCQGFTAQLHWAIITAIEHQGKNFPANHIKPPFLDAEHRYQWLAQLPVSPSETKPESSLGIELYPVETATFPAQLQGHIIDRNPLRSPEILAEHPISVTEARPIPPPTSLPQSALPYWRLRHLTPSTPALPQLQDTWHADHQEIVILQDRSDRSLLTEVVNHQTTVWLQVVYWCYELLVLWPILAEVDCCQSLLQPGNLRIDEDQTLSLQRLYIDSPGQPPTITQLVERWQTWFAQVDEVPGSLLQSISQVMDENGEDEARLREHLLKILEAVATEPSTLQEEDKDSSMETPTAALSKQLLRLEVTGRTEIGLKRSQNEDYFQIKADITQQVTLQGQWSEAQCLCVLCDGMGGHARGEVASRLAVETLQATLAEIALSTLPSTLPNAEQITTSIHQANQAIYNINQATVSSGSARMGTTLVMALVRDTQIAIAHVGDSRAYCVSRRRGLEQLTLDHEVGQRDILRGLDPEIAYGRPDAYQLTQALGPREQKWIFPDIQFLDCQEDCLFLLCSDGLSDYRFVEERWEELLQPLLKPTQNLEQGLDQLIDQANQVNGHDNITAILLRLQVQPHLKRQDTLQQSAVATSQNQSSSHSSTANNA